MAWSAAATLVLLFLTKKATGLRAKDDTVPQRWFEENNTAGPFKGEHIDREEFEKLKLRFYELTGLNSEGVPKRDWHERLARVHPVEAQVRGVRYLVDVLSACALRTHRGIYGEIMTCYVAGRGGACGPLMV